jgi:SAM-dependent methyltransferase
LRERLSFGEGTGDIACGFVHIADDPSRGHVRAALRGAGADIGSACRHLRFVPKADISDVLRLYPFMSGGFFEGTEMPTAGWWEALWPDPAGVLSSVGLKPGMEVLDLCSGDGWFTLQIARIARHVAAIDIDPTLLEVARVRLMEAGVTNCSFIVGDAYDITRLWPEPVDLVFMANAFHGVPDAARLATVVKAALKPSGRFAIVNWHARPREETIVLG